MPSKPGKSVADGASKVNGKNSVASLRYAHLQPIWSLSQGCPFCGRLKKTVRAPLNGALIGIQGSEVKYSSETEEGLATCCEPGSFTQPRVWEDPNNGATLGLHNLHHRSVRVQNWEFHFLDPPRALESLRSATGQCDDDTMGTICPRAAVGAAFSDHTSHQSLGFRDPFSGNDGVPLKGFAVI